MKSVAISISFRLKCSLMTFELFSKSSEAFNRNRPKKSNLKCNSSAYAMLCDYKKCENQWCLSADVTDVMHLETASLNMFCCEFQTLIFWLYYTFKSDASSFEFEHISTLSQ